ncbi:heavy metal translocating P-type ATPase [Halomicrobium katesii]|uniref:heavy metal translocating P-type ATPase n=1 Tax=Halomicrobium katesii TaxID=437163 RepID=UPI0003661F3A|nr:cation-translocating P-type ATPase [Halomicrobium katesii]
MDECTLCGLSTPDPPHTAPDVDGAFCCQGCLTVARTLDDAPADADPQTAVDTGPDVATADGDRAYFDVDGMHCATCETFLEATATDAPGVRAAEASYTAGMVRVVFDPATAEPDAIADRISGHGYDATREGAASADDAQETVGRLMVGGFFGMMVMAWYVLFLYPVYTGVAPSSLLVDLDGPAGGFLFANVWVMATVVVAYTGYPLFRGAVVSLRVGHPNMDLLVAIAAATAYVYSTIAMALGQTDLYFDVAVVVVLAVTVGDYYQERVRRRAMGRLATVSDERADAARRRTADGTESVSRSAVDGGDELVVKGGEPVPVDGTVVEGTAAVDESLVTGESLPVSKATGDAVLGGTTVTDGGVVVRADEDPTSTVDRLAETLWDVQSATPGAQRLVDRIAAVFVPLVFVLAVGTLVVHLLAGTGATAALLTGLTVLVVSCPCALGLATPMAVAAGIRDALDAGIVITDDTALETAPAVETVALDKTGTLTTGSMTVRTVAGHDESLAYASAVEQFATHPVAEAISEAETPPDEPVTAFETIPGRGVQATVGDRTVLVGDESLFAARDWTVPSGVAATYDGAGDDAIASYVGWDGRVRGAVVVGDEVREGWQSVLDRLAADRRVVVITGDDRAAAEQFASHRSVDEVFAGVPPEAKAAVVDRLGNDGTVAMVGDGSNDAPALGAADLGITVESGTRLAFDAADVVVTDDSLAALPEVFATTEGTRRRIRENLGWAFLYNGIALPLAVVGVLNPLFAAVAMATSSLLVVLNSTRPVGSEAGS